MNKTSAHRGHIVKPFIHTFYATPLTGVGIESRSFEIIDREAPPHQFSPAEWEVVRRMIHTVGDFSIMASVLFSPGAIAAGIKALKGGSPLYTDSNMIRAGLSVERLQSVNDCYGKDRIHCHIADTAVAKEAKDSGLPRSIHALRKARAMIQGGIMVFGNAPLGLLELNRLIMEEGIRPALVIAMPVGFVHVKESKEELISLDVPFITLTGRRGGSPLAVSVIHALCTLATSLKGDQRHD